MESKPLFYPTWARVCVVLGGLILVFLGVFLVAVGGLQAFS